MVNKRHKACAYRLARVLHSQVPRAHELWLVALHSKKFWIPAAQPVLNINVPQNSRCCTVVKATAAASDTTKR